MDGTCIEFRYYFLCFLSPLFDIYGLVPRLCLDLSATQKPPIAKKPKCCWLQTVFLSQFVAVSHGAKKKTQILLIWTMKYRLFYVNMDYQDAEKPLFLKLF